MHLFSSLHCTNATKNISRTTQETLGKLINNIATAVATELKMLSVQVPVSQPPTKQEVLNAPGFSTTLTMSGPISAPPLLPQLNREDYENIKHWGPNEYKFFQKGNNNQNCEKPLAGTKGSVLSSFMEQADETQVKKEDKSATQKTARAFFEALFKTNCAPISWGNARIDIQHQLINILKTEYPWLR